MGCRVCKQSRYEAAPATRNSTSTAESHITFPIKQRVLSLPTAGAAIRKAAYCPSPEASDGVPLPGTTRSVSETTRRSSSPNGRLRGDDRSGVTDEKAKLSSQPNEGGATADNRRGETMVAIDSSTEIRHGLPHRELSACRLKRSIDIAEVYDVSASQVLGTAKNFVNGKKFAIKTLSLEGVGQKKGAMLHNEGEERPKLLLVLGALQVSIYLKLDHPNIAKLIEVYETEKNIHLVMELCTGGELYDRLAAKKRYRERDAANVTRQMLSAINYCHQHRICHRDLKLENWVYADESEDAPLKLIDFGFSRIFNPGVPMTAMHGTVYYVSPEVMDGCYEEKCDIWSIGVIVYMLLSGSPPFNGSYDHEILIKIKRGAFTFSGPRWEGVSGVAKNFVAFLLCKDPEQRPSAEEALRHPWLQTGQAEDRELDPAVVTSMREYVYRGRTR